ncbi:hypothetical protein BKA56DRAFT_39907 [Ilyonectria sp. MPI-CAGE-AT-0026]|nr:hypothetical protein BKA56DRAFT_39907 [Ilyonectria sp. MPI-CAGE-AT-0026]
MRRTATSAFILLVPECDAGPVVTTPSIGCSPRGRCEIQRSVGASLSGVSLMLEQNNNQCHLPTPCPLCCSCHWSVNDTPPAEKAPKVQNVQLLPPKRRAGMRLLDGPHSIPPLFRKRTVPIVRTSHTGAVEKDAHILTLSKAC